MSRSRGLSSAVARRSGFTLIEVLATLVVVSIVMAVALQGLSLAVGAAGLSRKSVEAAALAESKLQEIITSEEWSGGGMSGDFGEEWPGYTWVCQSLTRDVDLMEVEVKVIWTARGRQRSVGVSTLLYTMESLGEEATDPAATGTGATGAP